MLSNLTARRVGFSFAKRLPALLGRVNFAGRWVWSVFQSLVRAQVATVSAEKAADGGGAQITMPSCPGETAAPSPERWQVAVSSLQAASSAGLQLEIRGCNKVLSNWSAIAWNGGLDGLRGLRAAKLAICKFLAEAVKQACSSLPNQHFARSLASDPAFRRLCFCVSVLA